MQPSAAETALLRFCELLDRWRESCRPDHLSIALVAVEAAAHRGDRDIAELMHRAIGAVIGVRVTMAAPTVCGERALH